MSRTKSFSIYFTLASLGLFSVLLALSACSRSKQQSSNPNPTSSASTQSQPVLRPVSAEIKKPEKTVEKKIRSATASYRSSTYGVAFDYPSKYTLNWGAQAKLEPNGSQPLMMFTEDGGHRIATVQIHSGFFPKTDLDSAFFNVSVNRHISAGDCSKFNFEVESKADPEDGIVIGDRLSETRYVHHFEKDVCYEFALGLKTRDTGDDDTLRPVDRKKVFAKLQEILGSVSFDGDQCDGLETEVKSAETKPESPSSTETKIESKTTDSKPESSKSGGETKPQSDQQ